MMTPRSGLLTAALAALYLPFASPVLAQEADAKPNILVIWGDDIGQFNISANNFGMMGYRTPNIDRIYNEGAMFTDWYGQQSCTAGRAAFITGQSPIRTGLTKVGLPGAPEGMNILDPTIAGLLKPLGYMTGQYGKNHLGDLDEMFPTNNGFDEFFGNLYHLNAEEEPQSPDYPRNPEFKEQFGPRGVIKSTAIYDDDGALIGQDIVDTGPLTRERMETVDEEVTEGALAFMEKAHAAGKPFFLWWNSTRMHIFTHLKPESRGVTGLGVYADGMVEHDAMVGQLLDKLEELGIADNTIVMYSTDNGPHMNTWPDGAMTPFRNEKNSNWEGAFRVPEMIRWPGKITAGAVSNEIIQHHDWLPTLLAAAGEPDIVEKLKKGHTAGADGNTEFKVHIDGYNLLPYLTGEVETSPRRGFFYFSDDGDLVAMRFENWKAVFMEQRCPGTLRVWAEPFTTLRVPKLFNLRTDPYEFADVTSNTYYEWLMRHDYFIFYMTAMAAKFLDTFKEFPPRHPPASFSVDQAVEKLHQFLAHD